MYISKDFGQRHLTFRVGPMRLVGCHLCQIDVYLRFPPSQIMASRNLIVMCAETSTTH